MSYFKTTPVVYASLDADLVEARNAQSPKPFAVEGIDHPRFVLLPEVTLRVIEEVQKHAESDDTTKGAVMVALMVSALRGDWSLYPGGAMGKDPGWASMLLIERMEFSKNLLSSDVQKLSRLIEDLIGDAELDEEDLGK